MALEVVEQPVRSQAVFPESGLDDDVGVIEEQVKGMILGQEEEGQIQSDLHRFCAEGNLGEVRGILSRSLDGLETLDMGTGCTPIVLAIRNNHPDVVRELLSARAIVPPPGLTHDPLMLSILYPQPMYGMPPFMPPQDYYPQPQRFFRQEQNPANLPPAEVAKTIPCRNFPNCKYGSSCVFLHPRPQPYYPGPNFMPNFEGYNQFPPGAMGMPGPYYVPNGFPPPFPSQDPSIDGHQHSQIPPQTTSEIPVSDTQHDHTQPQPTAQPFVPAYHQPEVMSPPSQFGMSPISPSLLASSLPSVPPPEAFYAATSPTNSTIMPPPLMNGAAPSFAPGHARRQSFNQPPFGMRHGKKLSFSGGPRPFGRPSMGGNLGSWKDGNPPPCAFFNQGKCRNGEFCKFPHLDETGSDCRHPDIIRGLIPPMPAMSRQPRAMRMGNFGPFDPAFRQQQQFLQQRAAQEQASTNPDPIAEAETPGEPINGSVTPPTLANPTPPITRSASQPGVQRVNVNGFTSRAHSPAPSNVSFHGNGHPRRTGGPVRAPFVNGQINGQRSSSAGAEAKQRIPGADDFPALGGMNGASEKAQPQYQKGTAAQVLSQPAPPKPVESPKLDEDTTSVNGKSDGDSVTAESEPDSDVIIVTHKPPPAPATRSQRNSVSFASAVSTIGSNQVGVTA